MASYPKEYSSTVQLYSSTKTKGMYQYPGSATVPRTQYEEQLFYVCNCTSTHKAEECVTYHMHTRWRVWSTSAIVFYQVRVPYTYIHTTMYIEIIETFSNRRGTIVPGIVLYPVKHRYTYFYIYLCRGALATPELRLPGSSTPCVLERGGTIYPVVVVTGYKYSEYFGVRSTILPY